MEVVIRRVETTDAAMIRSVRLQALASDPASFASTHEREAGYDDLDWEEWAVGDASGDDMATFLALNGPAPVGIVAAYRDETEPLSFHVMSMWVSSEVRRGGIGRSLLQIVEEWVVASGGDCVQLSVANQARAACRLYEISGYRPDGASKPSPHTMGIIHISLRKNLRPSV
jgi:ribosomal protein S18 acetylase RimI-like enzyme